MQKPWAYVIFLLFISALLLGCSASDDPAPGGVTTGPIIPPAFIDDPGSTFRVSVAEDLIQANAASVHSAVSANGEVVVFDSLAGNIDGQGSGGFYQVYLKNRRDESVYRISTADNNAIADGNSEQPDISDDAQFVVFQSDAGNLVANDNNQASDVFLYDALQHQLQRISLNSDGSEANSPSSDASISADGRYVVFQSDAALTAEDSNSFSDIYLYDRVNASIRLLTPAANGASTQARISADGSMVAFASMASNLDKMHTDLNDVSDVYRITIGSGQIDLVSINNAGNAANGDSDSPSLNGDGSVIAFRSTAGDLTGDGAAKSIYQVYANNMSTQTLEIISLSNSGEQANASIFSGTVMSDNGQYVGYYTAADNLHINDDNGVWDVYLRDRINNNTQLVSVSSNGVAGFGSSFVPAISSSGKHICFGSTATNLVENDTNDEWDVFIHVLRPHNAPPVAIAGDDLSVAVGDSVTLNGEQSYDPDATASGSGPVNAYQWTLVSKPTASTLQLSDPTLASFDVVVDVAGTYVFELVVNDGVQDSVPDSVSITAGTNLAPLPDIQISPLSGAAPLTVYVSAAASSDPEGDALSYAWNFADPYADSANPNSSNRIATSHTYTRAGTYYITLTVTDSQGNAGQAIITVTVN